MTSYNGIGVNNDPHTFNFGFKFGYTISGKIFNDINKNKIQDAGDEDYTGPASITIIPSGGVVTINPDNSYIIQGLVDWNIYGLFCIYFASRFYSGISGSGSIHWSKSRIGV